MSAARPDTWMPLYWGDYARDTGHFGATHHGAYLMLIKHYWCTGQPLPDDDNQLWRIATCDGLRHWQKIKPLIEPLFQVVDGQWRHKRVEEELVKAESFLEKQRQNGRRGGRPKNPGKSQNESQTKPNGKPKAKPEITTSHPPSPSPSPSPSPESMSDEWDGVRRFVPLPGSEPRKKSQTAADQDMVKHLMAHAGMTWVQANDEVVGARNGNVQAARDLERISRVHHIGWFAGDAA